MNWKVGATSAFLILVELLHTTHGLRCYVCNSAYQRRCDKDPSTDYIVDCTPETAQPLAVTLHGKLIANTNKASISPPAVDKQKRLENSLALESETQLALSISSVNYTFCRKTITSIPRQHNKDNIKEADKRIVRSCGWIDDGRMNTCKWSDSGEIQNEYCVCSGKDECNHGGQLAASVISLGLMAIIACILQ